MTSPDRAGTLEGIGAGDGIRLGLRDNLAQFTLLAVVSFLVGGMVGLERTVTPLVGTEQFARRRRPGQSRRRARGHRPDHHHPRRPAGTAAPGRDRYLGFIFAAAATRDEVEQALITARDQLRVTIQ